MNPREEMVELRNRLLLDTRQFTAFSERLNRINCENCGLRSAGYAIPPGLRVKPVTGMSEGLHSVKKTFQSINAVIFISGSGAPCKTLGG